MRFHTTRFSSAAGAPLLFSPILLAILCRYFIFARFSDAPSGFRSALPPTTSKFSASCASSRFSICPTLSSSFASAGELRSAASICSWMSITSTRNSCGTPRDAPFPSSPSMYSPRRTGSRSTR